MIVLYLAPLLVAAAFLGFSKQPPWVAGAAALASAIPGVLIALPPGANAVSFFAVEGAKGIWLAWSAIAVMAGGLFFHQATDSRDRAVVTLTPRNLFVIAYLLGGFMETTVGFGISFVVVVSILRRSGLAPLPSILLGLFGHLFVPWGALAVGSMIGAELAHLSLQQLGLTSALLVAAIGLCSLPFYWLCLQNAGIAQTRADRIDDFLWLAFTLAALIGAHFVVPMQLAALTALGGVMALRRLRDGPASSKALIQDIKHSAHYIILCVALLASRLIPALKDLLERAFAFTPFEGSVVYAPLYNPSAFLITIGLAFGLARKQELGRIAAITWAGGWRAFLVTALFITLARWLTASGIADSLAHGMIAATGPQGVALAPIIGAATGFLTGSNTASNAIMMPIQSALDVRHILPTGMLAAVQNVSGSMLTALSPMRISMARALAGEQISEGSIYAAAWPFGAIALSILIGITTWFVFAG